MTRFITGFYHDSPLWIDDEPLITAETLDVAAMQREVFRQRLECGLEMLVTCDGLFAFDFSGLPTTQTITTAATADFDMSAKEALQQTQIMNAYLMLLYTALRQENLPEPHHLLVVTPHLRIGLHEFSATAQLTVHWRVAHLVNSRAVSSYARAVDYRLDERIKYRTGPIPARLVAVAAEALDRLIQSQGTEGTALLGLIPNEGVEPVGASSAG